jgi:hypothetical protein
LAVNRYLWFGANSRTIQPAAIVAERSIELLEPNGAASRLQKGNTMTRQFVLATLALTLCFAASLAHSEPRGKEGEKSRGGGRPPGGNQAERKSEEQHGSRGAKQGGNKSPGGEWSERTHGGKQSTAQTGSHREQPGTTTAAAGHAATKNKTPQATGAQGAAAGAAASNRKSPQASGAEGAAAGAAAANRKSPQATGAEGAAAGAAAANRKSPQATGAEGAAAGAAAANRRSPQVSGAEGAAAGAAAANRRSPQVSGAEGAAAGAAVANRNEPAVSGAGGAAAGYAAVKNSFNHPNIYGQQWYGDHPGAWASPSWAAGAVWAPVTWGAVSNYCGYGSAAPISYDYGVNVVAQNGNVLVDGQSVGTTDEFSQQAADLAETGTDAETSDTEPWLPVGVFAMVRNEQQHPQLIVQLAISKQGILRGNYTDEITDHTLPIHGAVDKQTQRAAWTVGGNKQTVMEAGMSDLTDGEAPALIHKNGKTDHWLLVRLEQPKSDGNGAEK